MAAEDRRPGEDPAREPADDDAVWTELVAAFHASDGEPPGGWPAGEDVPEEPAGPPAADRAPAPHAYPQAHHPHPQPHPQPQHATRHDAEEHYVPPPPPPLPRGDRVSRAAWAAVLGVPVLLVLATLLGWQLSSLQAGLAIGAFVAGFATLVARMRTGDSHDPGGGAVV